jgi:hypothetical protein
MNIGFLGLLQLIFIVLKLTNSINWSWWWVFTPVYVWIVGFILIVWLISWMDKKYPLWRVKL